MVHSGAVRLHSKVSNSGKGPLMLMNKVHKKEKIGEGTQR